MAGVTAAAKRKAAKPAAPAASASSVAPANPASPPSHSTPIAVMRVVGPVQGRRRAGRAFVAEEVVIPLSELTEADVTALQTDPMLATVLDAIDPADLDA